MRTVQTFTELNEARVKLPKPMGFIPTMGYLHAGHLSLVQAAREECASVVVSSFVNPTQFGPQEDFGAYPRDYQRDMALLEPAGVDLVWMPTPEIMYPPGYQTWVSVENVTRPLEGAMRPGHFRGVATVVAKLFIALQPDRAYFGRKDAQQVIVIRQMTKDLNFPVEIVVCPTKREADGLAMASRNTYLNPQERQAATILYRALNTARDSFNSGETDANRLRQVMMNVLGSEPMARVQYVSCANLETLEEFSGSIERALLSMAVYIGKTRLIDNIVIGI